MFILIYVYDIIIIASVPFTIDELLQLIRLEFVVKDLGDLNFFLGVEVLQLKFSLLLVERHYILDLLKRTNMLEAKPITFHMSSSSSLSTFEGDLMEDPSIF